MRLYKSLFYRYAASILVFHTAFILPGFANAGTSTTATSSAGGAPIVVNLTAAQEATMATSLAGWGSFNAFAPIVAPPAPAATSKTSAAAPAVTVTLPPAAAAAAAKVASPAFQASLTAAVNSSMANFNPTTYAAANPDSKQMDLINLLNSGQYAQAFTYAKANGMDLLEDLETASGLESLMSPSSSLNPFPLPVTLNPFSKTQMEAYYAAAAAAIGNGTLPSSPVQGSCMEGTVDAGCAVQDTQTQSNYIWVTPTASEADKNAAASTLPNLLGYSAIGQPPPKDSAGLDIAVGVILGVMTAGVGAVVGSAIAAGVGVASSAVTTAIGSAIVAGAVNGVTSVAEGGSFLSGLESGLIGGALGGAVALSGVTSDISSGLVDSGVNSTVAQDVAGFAVNTATGTALNGGNIGAAALGAGEGTAENAGLGILQGTPTNSNTDMGIAASNAATAAYAAGNFPGIDLPPGTIANSEADTTAAIASAGLQASGVSLDGTSDVTGQDQELNPIQTTATKLPVGVTAPGSVDPLSPVDVTANKTLPAGGFAAVIGSTGADGSATSGGELSSNVSSLTNVATSTLAGGSMIASLGGAGAGESAPYNYATGNYLQVIDHTYDDAGNLIETAQRIPGSPGYGTSITAGHAGPETLGLAYVDSDPQFAAQFGFASDGYTLQMPGNASTINNFINNYNATASPGAEINVNFYDSGGYVSDLTAAQNWANDGSLVFSDSDTYHFHDVGQHFLGYAALPEDVVAASQNNTSIALQILNDPVLSQNELIVNQASSYISGIVKGLDGSVTYVNVVGNEAVPTSTISTPTRLDSLFNDWQNAMGNSSVSFYPSTSGMQAMTSNPSLTADQQSLLESYTSQLQTVDGSTFQARYDAFSSLTPNLQVDPNPFAPKPFLPGYVPPPVSTSVVEAAVTPPTSNVFVNPPVAPAVVDSGASSLASTGVQASTDVAIDSATASLSSRLLTVGAGALDVANVAGLALGGATILNSYGGGSAPSDLNYYLGKIDTNSTAGSSYFAQVGAAQQAADQTELAGEAGEAILFHDVAGSTVDTINNAISKVTTPIANAFWGGAQAEAAADMAMAGYTGDDTTPTTTPEVAPAPAPTYYPRPIMRTSGGAIRIQD